MSILFSDRKNQEKMQNANKKGSCYYLKLKDYKISSFKVGDVVLEGVTLETAVHYFNKHPNSTFSALIALKRRQSIQTYVNMLERYFLNHNILIGNENFVLSKCITTEHGADLTELLIVQN